MARLKILAKMYHFPSAKPNLSGSKPGWGPRNHAPSWGRLGGVLGRLGVVLGRLKILAKMYHFPSEKPYLSGSKPGGVREIMRHVCKNDEKYMQT